MKKNLNILQQLKAVKKSTINYLSCFICITAGSLYSQNSYTFTNCGATGRLGPTQAQINTAYGPTNLNGLVTTVSGVQNFTVPFTGPYNIQVIGASGGSVALYSGYGANAVGDVTLTGGSVLSILVGQMCPSYAPSNSDGGGGGSFVAVGPTLLFAAGGGGGAAQSTAVGQNAQTTTVVANGIASQFGSSGASYSVNGTNFTYGPYATVAQAFTNGGNGQAGGQAGGWPGTDHGDGGFGGGGSSCSCSTGGGGGGGGFVGGGGGACCYTSGFGGSSYIIGAALNASVTVQNTFGHGKVIITQLCNNIPVGPPDATNANNYTLCPSNTTTLAATGTGTISWYASQASTLVLGTGTTFITPTLTPGTHTFYAAETNTCSQGPKTPITVTVVPPPAITFSGNASVCNGYTVNLSASGINTYTWSTGANTSTINAVANGQFTVSGFNAASGCSNTAVTTLTLLPAPTVAVTGPTAVCAGSTANLAASGADMYFWNTGATTSTIAPTVTNNVTYTITGTYTLNGCTTKVTKPIISNALPSLTVTGTSTMCPGQSVTLTASGAPGFFWSTGASTASVVLSPGGSTNYSLVGVSNAGCTSTLVVPVNVVVCDVGIKPQSNAPGVPEIYPNPTNGEFTIELNGNPAKNFEIADLTGRIILKGNFEKDITKINLNAFSNGVYFIKTQSNNKVEIFKIVKQ